MNKIKCGDKVVVISGKEKGKIGFVKEIIIKLHRNKLDVNKLLIVEGINMVKKHIKSDPKLKKSGYIISKESPIHISNIAILNISSNKPDKIGVKTFKDGSKLRFFKSSGKILNV